jgi:hypothetical protein
VTILTRPQPHEYLRGGTAKLLMLFRPATSEVRAKGVSRAPNAVLHPWLQNELLQILAELPEPPAAPETQFADARAGSGDRGDFVVPSPVGLRGQF